MNILLSILLLLSPLTYSFSTCEFCIELTQHLQNTLIKITPESFVKSAVQLVCEKKCNFQQYFKDDSQQLCKHVSQELTPLAIQSGVKAIIKQGRICQFMCGANFYQTFDLNNIQKSLRSQSDKMLENWTPKYEKIILKQSQIQKFRVLHLTDIHLDLNYTQKASNICSMPVCCHVENGFPQTQSAQALPYGAIKCDTPIKLLDKALDYIQVNISEVDLVIVTGDFSAHNQWQKTPQTVKFVRSLVEQKIKEKVNTQYIFTAPGNNQYFPDHQVDPSSVPQQSIRVLRLYDSKQQNYVTFVSINTLFCDTMNIYLIEDQTGPIRQLKMLQKILEDNSNIYLLGHISLTSGSCSKTYSLIYRTILNKYKQKILGQFFGHTHLDQFVVNTNPKNIQQITSFGLLGGSLSPLGTGTSRFRVYQLNQNNFKLQNYLDYQLKLNQNNFRLNYEFKKYYQFDDQVITAESMKKFQKRMQNDDSLKKKYANELTGRQTNNIKAYCQSYDNDEQISACLNQTTLSIDINKYLQLIQGPWGSYGYNIQ